MRTAKMPVGAALAIAALTASLGACVDRHMDGPPSALAPSPSAVVIGVEPAPPQGETEQATPVEPVAKPPLAEPAQSAQTAPTSERTDR